MGDPLNGAGAKEEAEGKHLAELAGVVAQGALSATTIRAAQAALVNLQKADGGSALGEPARDLLALRSQPAVRSALAADLNLAQSLSARLLNDALWMGFQQGAKLRSEGLPIVVDLTEADRADLIGYPIAGYTVDEIAADLRYQLGRDADRILAAPIAGLADPATIPASLGNAAFMHAGRVSRAVDEAHATGVGAAVRAIGEALTGAA